MLNDLSEYKLSGIVFNIQNTKIPVTQLFAEQWYSYEQYELQPYNLHAKHSFTITRRIKENNIILFVHISNRKQESFQPK